MVDTGDLKSLASNGVRVQVPPWAPVFMESKALLGVRYGGVVGLVASLGTSPAMGRIV